MVWVIWGLLVVDDGVGCILIWEGMWLVVEFVGNFLEMWDGVLLEGVELLIGVKGCEVCWSDVFLILVGVGCGVIVWVLCIVFWWGIVGWGCVMMFLWLE